MENDQPHRVALYWAPRPDSDLWRAGCRWLGRDAATGENLAQPLIGGIDPKAFRALTADPRRYGWHATLKPPFRLREDAQLMDVDLAVQKLASRLAMGSMPTLRVAPLGQFLALRPQGSTAAINAIAAACVQALHPLARPLSNDELKRRRHMPLTPKQDALLQRWGYPWVLDEFRLHCSLTGSLNGLDAEQQAALMQTAQRTFDHLLVEPLDSIAVFIEPSPGADFILHRHWDLQA
jgi:putative phosphonate metabolism protein